MVKDSKTGLKPNSEQRNPRESVLDKKTVTNTPRIEMDVSFPPLPLLLSFSYEYKHI